MKGIITKEEIDAKWHYLKDVDFSDKNPSLIDRLSPFNLSNRKSDEEIIDDFRKYNYKQRLQKVYERSSTYSILNNIGLGKVTSYILNNTINRNRIKTDIETRNRKDKTVESILIRLSFNH